MMDFSKEINQSPEVNSPEMRTPKNQDTSSIPTNGDLKEKMQYIFPERVDGEMEQPTMSEETPIGVPDCNDGTITLDDGTKIELPETEEKITLTLAENMENVMHDVLVFKRQDSCHIFKFFGSNVHHIILA